MDMELAIAPTKRVYVIQVGLARVVTNQIALAIQTVLVVVIATPPIVKHLNVLTASWAGWVPRVTTLACTDIRCAGFACAILVTWVTVVN